MTDTTRPLAQIPESLKGLPEPVITALRYAAMFAAVYDDIGEADEDFMDADGRTPQEFAEGTAGVALEALGWTLEDCQEALREHIATMRLERELAEHAQEEAETT